MKELLGLGDEEDGGENSRGNGDKVEEERRDKGREGMVPVKGLRSVGLMVRVEPTRLQPSFSGTATTLSVQKRLKFRTAGLGSFTSQISEPTGRIVSRSLTSTHVIKRKIGYSCLKKCGIVQCTT